MEMPDFVKKTCGPLEQQGGFALEKGMIAAETEDVFALEKGC